MAAAKCFYFKCCLQSRIPNWFLRTRWLLQTLAKSHLIINDLGGFYNNLPRYDFEKFKIECNRIPFKDSCELKYFTYSSDSETNYSGHWLSSEITLFLFFYISCFYKDHRFRNIYCVCLPFQSVLQNDVSTTILRFPQFPYLLKLPMCFPCWPPALDQSCHLLSQPLKVSYWVDWWGFHLCHHEATVLRRAFSGMRQSYHWPAQLTLPFSETDSKLLYHCLYRNRSHEKNEGFNY